MIWDAKTSGFQLFSAISSPFLLVQPHRSYKTGPLVGAKGGLFERVLEGDPSRGPVEGSFVGILYGPATGSFKLVSSGDPSWDSVERPFTRVLHLGPLGAPSRVSVNPFGVLHEDTFGGPLAGSSEARKGGSCSGSLNQVLQGGPSRWSLRVIRCVCEICMHVRRRNCHSSLNGHPKNGEHPPFSFRVVLRRTLCLGLLGFQTFYMF